MAISVQAPNGDVVQFPDGTPDDVINDAMAKEYGGGQASFSRNIAGADPKAAPDAASDIGASFLTGLRRGVVSIPGLPGTLEHAGRELMDWIGRKRGFDPETVKAQKLPTAADYQNLDQVDVGPYYQPKTTAGEYARSVGEFAPGAAMPGGPAQRLLMGVVGPAVTSETAGQVTKGTDFEPAARVAGGFVGGRLPTTVGRAVTPFPASPARAEAVRTLEQEGVTGLTAAQRTGSRPLEWIETTAKDTPLSSSAMSRAMDVPQRQYTQAVLRRVGENADEATPEVMRRAPARIGAEFDRLSQQDMVFGASPVGQQARQDLARRVQQAEIEYENTVLRSEHSAQVERIVDQINRELLDGTITGPQYQHWRSRLGAATASTENPVMQRFLGQVQAALDDAREMMLSPADAAAWRTARDQWAHLVELRSAMAGAGETIASGQVTPQRLRMADAAQDSVGYVEGTGRYSDLARAGVQVMPTLPNSGTPARLAAMNAAGVVTGAAGGALFGGAPGAALGSVAGLAAPGIAFRGYLNPWVQAYLGNQVLAGPMNAANRTGSFAAQGLTAPAQAVEDKPAIRGAQPGDVHVTSFEEALKLKKGTRFIDPYGVARVR